MPLHVEQLRGDTVETVHPIVAALSDGERVLWAVGPEFSCFWRSACKPMQLLTSLEQLPAALVDALPDADVALGASSHSGEPAHVARVAALADRLGISAEGLRCGAHWPYDEASKMAMLRRGETASALHNNCSGKHSFMLAASLARGWDPDYLPLAHPLQAQNRARIEDWCGHRAAVAVDGCGVPCFAVPVRTMARGFARLAHHMADRDGLASRIGWAMAREPEMVSGTGRLDLAVTRGAREPLACKFGAEGLFAIALPERRQGLVVKALTGNGDALAVGVRAVLDELAPGLLTAEDWPWADVANVVGKPVGRRRAVWVA